MTSRLGTSANILHIPEEIEGSNDRLALLQYWRHSLGAPAQIQLFIFFQRVIGFLQLPDSALVV